MKLYRYNVNDYVRVKLKPKGRNYWQFETWRNNPNVNIPEADADGFHRLQLWHLMNVFGPVMYMGGELPFETEIFFEMRDE